MAAVTSHASLDDARDAMEQFRQAASELQAAQATADEDELERLAQAVEENLNRARKLFDAHQAHRSRDAGVLMDYAEALTVMGDIDLAIEVYERVVEREPMNGAAWRRLGESYAAMGSNWLSESYAALRKSIEVSTDESEIVESHVSLAAQLAENGFHDLAQEHFEAVLDLRPDHPFARSAHAILGIREGAVLHASDTLDEVGLLPPRPAAITSRMLHDALDAFERARLAVPDDAEHHAAYAKLLLRANRVPQSAMPLIRSLKLDPDVYVHWNLMASIQLYLGDIQEARRAYERSIELNPDQPRVIEVLEAIEEGEEPDIEVAPEIPPALEPPTE